MSAFVLDCSVAMRWCFEGERSKESQEILKSLVNGEAIVPPIWSLEVANVLATAERRQRISVAESNRFLNLLSALPIRTDRLEPGVSSLLEWARSLRVTAYDACYLHLAAENDLPLATFDMPLRRAAQNAGIKLHF